MNQEQLKEFLEAKLKYIFGENVDSFKNKVNFLRQSKCERESQPILDCSIPIRDSSDIVGGNSHVYMDIIEDKNSRELAAYYALAIHILEENNPYKPLFGWVHAFCNEVRFNQILSLVELYRPEGINHNQNFSLKRKRAECRYELEKLKKEEFISFSLLDYSISLADVLRAELATKKINLLGTLEEIREGCSKCPQEIINKSILVSFVKSESSLLNQLDSEHRVLEKSKTYLEKDLQTEFPYYGNLLKIKFRQIVDTAFGGKKTLYRAALLEFYKDRFYIKPSFFSANIQATTDDSVSEELANLKL